jgi:hypothetical protein
VFILIYGIRRNKIFILIIYTASCSGAIFFINAIGKEKTTQFGDLEAILLSPDRSVLNLFLSW